MPKLAKEENKSKKVPGKRTIPIPRTARRAGFRQTKLPGFQAFPRRRPASARFSVFRLSPLWLGITRIWYLKKEVELSCIVVVTGIECGLGTGVLALVN